jgi:hypothetical protein
MFWDGLLLVVVTAMAVALSYLRDPRWKAVILTLPIPFTVTFLALGARVDTLNLAGMCILWMFTHLVRILHRKGRWPIILAIFVPTLFYIVFGSLAALIIPRTDLSFLIGATLMLVSAVVVLLASPEPKEPGNRTLLPLKWKVPLTLLLVSMVLSLKFVLQGTMTFFPMVGVFGAYESRLSLSTYCRQIPRLMLAMVPMLVFMRYAQPVVGVAWCLIGGLLVYSVIMFPLMVRVFKTQGPLAKPQATATLP